MVDHRRNADLEGRSADEFRHRLHQAAVPLLRQGDHAFEEKERAH
jgi:hypothetical protein